MDDNSDFRKEIIIAESLFFFLIKKQCRKIFKKNDNIRIKDRRIIRRSHKRSMYVKLLLEYQFINRPWNCAYMKLSNSIIETLPTFISHGYLILDVHFCILFTGRFTCILQIEQPVSKRKQLPRSNRWITLINTFHYNQLSRCVVNIIDAPVAWMSGDTQGTDTLIRIYRVHAVKDTVQLEWKTVFDA